MKRLLPLAILAAGIAWFFPRDSASTAPAPAPRAAPRVVQLEEKPHAQVLDRAATEQANAARRDRFDANIAAIDAAIAQAEATGKDPEYIDALERRRQLLAEQAEAEAEG